MLLCSSAVLPLENLPRHIRLTFPPLARSVTKARSTLSKLSKNPKHLVILKEGQCKLNMLLHKARQLEVKVCLPSAHPLQMYPLKLLQQVNRRLVPELAMKDRNLFLGSTIRRPSLRLKTHPLHSPQGQTKHINRVQIDPSIDLVAPSEIWALLHGHQKIFLVLYPNLPACSALCRPRPQPGPLLKGPWLPQLVGYLPEGIPTANHLHLP